MTILQAVLLGSLFFWALNRHEKTTSFAGGK